MAVAIYNYNRPVLDLSLHAVTWRAPRGAFVLDDVSVTFPKSTHTAIVGAGGCGASTLLKLLTGELRPASGEVWIGARSVNELKPAKRPVLAVGPVPDVPGRWSVQHVLVAAVRQRTLDREDRHREYELAVEKWRLAPLLERRVDSLSSTERTLTQLARIELLRPGILIADRLLEGLSAAELPAIADDFYRTLRVIGTTTIGAPVSQLELGLTDGIVMLDRGRVVAQGSAAEVYAHPPNEAAARATGDVNVVPLTIRGNVVESPIGAWELPKPPFQGSGVALTRPDDFAVAPSGEDFDFVFGIEEASFSDGRWRARGLLTGGVILRVALPAHAAVHKGRLLPLRYDPARFTLLQREGAGAPAGVPTDAIPLLRDSR